MAHGAILFDLDGVLADSRRPIIDCVNAALVELGHGARSEAEVETTIGPPTLVGFSQLLDAPPDSDVVAEAVRAYRALYVDALWETPSYPGVPEVVRALAEEWTLGVATSKPRRYAEPVLEAIGLADAFAVVAGPVPDGPDDKLSMVIEATGALGGASAMIGDRHYDIEAAREQKLHAIGVTWGFGTYAELRAAGADVIVDQADELLEAATRARRFTSR